MDDRGHAVGFLWVTFFEITDYSITVAEVNDLEVSPELWRRGIGTQMLERAERVARRHGADLLRSGTGVGNVASQKMHEKYGFAMYYVHYEKLLAELPRRA